MLLTEIQKKRLKELASIKTEEKIKDKFYLYHATITKSDLSNLHSFRGGINSKKSIGMAASQGQGFYVFTSKKDALDRLRSESAVSSVGGYSSFSKERDGYPLVVTLEVDEIDPLKFDIDSEISGNVFVALLHKNIELFKNLNIECDNIKYALDKNPSRDAQILFWDLNTATAPLKLKNAIYKVSIQMDSTDFSKGDADFLGKYIKCIGYNNPELLSKLEKEMFETAEAIKYVGEEIIKPYKLEIIDDSGNLIDVTTNDPK